MANDRNAQNVIRRKLVIIGDGACGKTSLLSVFTLGFFPTHYVSSSPSSPIVEATGHPPHWPDASPF
jgi:GTPase SAR1 family protein